MSKQPKRCQYQTAIEHNLPRFCGKAAHPVRDSDGSIFIYLCDQCERKVFGQSIPKE